eukprot:TRINITY_DN7249_c0_g1_i1.p1 TRINITY_DN7249_c0_g1~~TRINITY_DN7249_c0_g1_i1.p1  ORF type:complete len:382 (+),score=119.50 TRINITY_DN7249_c0_g1_i1:243-1388(+)
MAAVAAAPSLSVTWSSSSGSSSARQDAVLRLHRLHFVDKRGSDQVQELVEDRCQESRRNDSRMMKGHQKKLNDLKARMDGKIANALKHGSMSVWSKEERDKCEEARRDPNEAVQKMQSEARATARSYREEKSNREAKVKAMPAMNVRGKEELAAIEEKRQDPDEAAQNMKTHMKQLAADYRQQKEEMMQRVNVVPPMSLRTKEKLDAIEELRRDPKEAREKMEKEMQERQQLYKAEKQAIMERVRELPDESSWTQAERDNIAEVRRDPQEAAAKMKQHITDVSKAWVDTRKQIVERTQQRAQMSFRSKEETERIEEARRDPKEARDRMTAHMKELAADYEKKKTAIIDKVEAIPAMTFRPKRERLVLDAVKRSQTARTPRI